ncbi:TetR/AcrR family transcriptional regulator [Hwanghaeella grinnelliae]|nr:TetR/AcrR family transcriptional regulator [Hwanghaeella grinnelliae]
MPEKRQKRYEETRDQLLEVAWAEFAANGFAQTSTENVVREAGVTRGALYYHFKDKTDMFRAVVDLAHIRILSRIEDASASAPSITEGLRRGCLAFLDACSSPDIRQIALIDGPSVLGWAEWREIDTKHGFGALRDGLTEAKRQKALRADADPMALAYLLSGAMNEAALALSDPELSKTRRSNLRRSMEAALLSMLAAFET